MAEVVIAVISTALVAVVWGIRQEGRITAQGDTLSQKIADNDKFHLQRVDSLKELIETKFDGMDGRLERIERGMNGHAGKGHGT